MLEKDTPRDVCDRDQQKISSDYEAIMPNKLTSAALVPRAQMLHGHVDVGVRRYIPTTQHNSVPVVNSSIRFGHKTGTYLRL